MPSTSSSSNKTVYLWALVPVLLVGLLMRSASLGEMTATMLTADEAWNGIDIVNLIQQPHFTPFLENNFGRESGWMYFQVPFVLVFGATPFALRFATVCVAALTLAAAARLGRELFGWRGALMSLAALSVFYWHVHLSQMALRVNTFILMSFVAAAYLLQASRTRKLGDWLGGGLCLGLLGYTYFAAYATLFYFGLLMVALAVWRPRQRLAGLALAVAVIVLVPMGMYALQHPAQFLFRSVTTSRLAPAEVLTSLRKWAGAWFVLGDDNAIFNYPGRPILGPVTGLLALLGLVNFVRERRYGLGALTLGWGLITWLPSLISEYAPHFVRASGLILPVVLLLANGLRLLADESARRLKVAGAGLLPLVLLLPVGAATYIDSHIKWPAHPDTFFYMEEHVNRSVDYLRHQAGLDDYIYFSPFDTGHPVVAFRSHDLAPRHVVGFGSHQCLVVPQRQAYYTSATIYEPDFEAALARWAQVKVVEQDTTSPTGHPRYTIFETEPDPARLNPPGLPVVRFGDVLDVHVLSPFSTTLKAGDQVTVWLGVQPLTPLSIYPSVFVHLYGVPTPYQGGRLWAQADSQLCATYPAPLWRADETIVQSFTLTIPGDIPPGQYSLAAGVYAGARLPITAPADTKTDYIVLYQFTIAPPAP